MKYLFVFFLLCACGQPEVKYNNVTERRWFLEGAVWQSDQIRKGLNPGPYLTNAAFDSIYNADKR